MKKTNRTFKRFAAITSASLLAACAVMPAVSFAEAAAPTVKITVSESADSTLVAYRILDASVSGSNYTYSVNNEFRAVLKAVTGRTTDDEIKSYIDSLDAEGTQAEKDANVREFADKVYRKILENGNITPSATTTSGVFDGVSQGYYLIAETGKGESDNTFSLVMLDTAGDTELHVDPKKALPTFEKKIKDADATGSETGDTGDTGNNGVWRDSADYNIGDDVPFQLTATLPSDYASYKQYKLVFHDDLRDKETDVEVYSIPTSFTVYYDADNDNVCDENEALTFSTSTPTDSCDFEIVIDNLKDHAAAAAGGKVKVEYTAELLNTANIGAAGNWNDAKLSYSNNPYHTGTGDTLSETPIDSVAAFTYQLSIDKVDKDDKPLSGAGFTLYKWDPNKEGGAGYVEAREEIIGTEANPITTFNYVGLDAGKYKIVETTVPRGYTKADDIEFVVKATHTDGATPELSGLTVNDTAGNTMTGEGKIFTVNMSTGLVATEIENLSGSELPGTGGIGTTIFYLGGGAMAAIGGVYLISKRRMKKSEE